MLNNNRDDDKFEGQEDSEYHFSDEEVSYEPESETDSLKNAPEKSDKENILTRFKSSRRMVISAVVFIVLLFVVYKLIAPTSTTPALNISPAPAPAASVNQPPSPVATPPLIVNSAPAANQTPSPAIGVQPPSVVPVQSVETQVAPPTSAPLTASQQMPTAQPSMESTIPTPLPVQSAAPVNQPMASASYSTPFSSGPMPTANMPSYQVPGAQAAQERAANLYNEEQRFLTQLQQEYTQRLNDFANQNKMLQDQLQTLNSRVAGLETQLNQLLQTLSKQNQSQNQSFNRKTFPTAPQVPEPKIAYNVQAIIPGRAWLKSENGETVTVAEGDLVKDLGRITKIDPYDGIVEINTGNKIISLSYGNSG